MTRAFRRGAVVALLFVAVLAMVAQLGSVPHLHAKPGHGLFNAEHDLTLLAGLAGHGVEVDAAPRLAPDAVAFAIASSPSARLASRVTGSTDSRAPPTV